MCNSCLAYTSWFCAACSYTDNVWYFIGTEDLKRQKCQHIIVYIDISLFGIFLWQIYIPWERDSIACEVYIPFMGQGMHTNTVSYACIPWDRDWKLYRKLTFHLSMNNFLLPQLLCSKVEFHRISHAFVVSGCWLVLDKVARHTDHNLISGFIQ